MPTANTTISEPERPAKKWKLRSSNKNEGPAKTRLCDHQSEEVIPKTLATALSRQTRKIAVLPTEILTLSDEDLTIKIEENHAARYKTRAKSLQITSVISLVRCRDTFVLAGTGYGKTRIAEMYLDLFPKSSKAIEIVLNPLDALGDNQVVEKKRWQIKAVNLTKELFTEEEALKILTGEYSVVYVSPEIFLNSKLFEIIYFSQWFQDHLILKVIDEAHMIYWWGLVVSGRAKHCIAFMRQQDGRQFRPSYGDLCLRILATNNIPSLLMSATCAPRPFTAILHSLSIRECDIAIIKGELSRSNIRIIRVKMKRGIGSAMDLFPIFAKKKEIPDSELLQTLIYSGSRNATRQVMQVVNQARGTVLGENDSDSTLIRRYHSCTGKKEKLQVIDGYTRGQFPIISCTNALGLGQDWPQVKVVIVMGRIGLPELAQLFGRCGRGESPGLAIHFVEEKRRKGANSIEDVNTTRPMSDDELMDTYAFAPVCLRGALSLANTTGLIPCKKEDERILQEKEREATAGFPICQCSNCNETAAEMLIYNLPRLTKSNYLQAMKDPFSIEEFMAPNTVKDIEEAENEGSKRPSKKRGGPLDSALEELADELVYTFDLHHTEVFGDDDYLESEDYFDLERARVIVKSLDLIKSELNLKEAMGGDIVSGGVKVIFDYIQDWRSRDEGQIFEHKRQKILDDKRQAVNKKAAKLASSINPTSTPETIQPKKTKKRRTSAQVKADKEGAILQAEYNKRCLRWLTVDKIRPEDIDGKEMEYQRSVESTPNSSIWKVLHQHLLKNHALRLLRALHHRRLADSLKKLANENVQVDCVHNNPEVSLHQAE